MKKAEDASRARFDRSDCLTLRKLAMSGMLLRGLYTLFSLPRELPRHVNGERLHYREYLCESVRVRVLWREQTRFTLANLW